MASSFRAGVRISTAFVESAINQIVDKRCDKRQSMRWTPRGAHLLLQTPTRVQETTAHRPCPRFVMRSMRR